MCAKVSYLSDKYTLSQIMDGYREAVKLLYIHIFEYMTEKGFFEHLSGEITPNDIRDWSSGNAYQRFEHLSDGITLNDLMEKMNISKDRKQIFSAIIQCLADMGVLEVKNGSTVLLKSAKCPFCICEIDTKYFDVVGNVPKEIAKLVKRFDPLSSDSTVKFDGNFNRFWNAIFLAPYYAYGRDEAVKWVGFEDATIADLGCGPGYALEKLAVHAGKHGRITAVEVSKDFLDIAAKRVNGMCKVDFIKSDVDNGLPFLESSKYDGVTAIGLLHFLRKPEQFLSEVNRILKPGGKFAMGNQYLIKPTMYQGATDLYFSIIGQYSKAHTSEQIRQMLSSSGLNLNYTFEVGNYGWFYARKE